MDADFNSPEFHILKQSLSLSLSDIVVKLRVHCNMLILRICNLWKSSEFKNYHSLSLSLSACFGCILRVDCNVLNELFVCAWVMVTDLESLEFDILSVTDLSLDAWFASWEWTMLIERSIEGALQCVGLALSRT